MWTAEPKLQGRHKCGLAVLIFLIIATILGYFSYRNIWAEAKRKVAPKGALDPDEQGEAQPRQQEGRHRRAKELRV